MKMQTSTDTAVIGLAQTQEAASQQKQQKQQQQQQQQQQQLIPLSPVDDDDNDDNHDTHHNHEDGLVEGGGECFEPRYGVKHPTKSTWSEEEDVQLTKLVAEYGAKNWPMIASHLPGRSGKQCRERFKNHLDPSLKKGPFTPEEDIILVKMIEVHGPRWAKIAVHLPGRTDNAIKNRYNSSLRRAHEEGRLVIPHHLPDRTLEEIVPATPPGSPNHNQTQTQTQQHNNHSSPPSAATQTPSKKRTASTTTPSATTLSTPKQQQTHVHDSDDENVPRPMFKRPRLQQQRPDLLFKCLLDSTTVPINKPTTLLTTRMTTTKPADLLEESDLMSAALALCELKTARFP